MKPIKLILEEYTENYLIVDGVYPIITSSTVYDEAIIYSLSKTKINNCISQFINISDKTIDSETKTTELSFGQKILLSMLFALNSSADNIFFHKVKSSINKNRFKNLQKFIELNFSHKNIIFSNE